MNDVIRILLADDHVQVRRGIRTLLDDVNGVEVVGEAGDGHEAVTLAEELNPDLVIMDISMPRLDGLSAAARIRDKLDNTRVLMLSMHNSPSLARQALKMGAQGYVLKRQATDELLTAVRLVHRGETFLSPSLGADAERRPAKS
jgi:DNA-binding NarL/FixJ family response regulator